LANLSTDSGNLANFESVWPILFCLAIWRISGDFLKVFTSKFFGLAKCTTCIFARICLHIHMQITIFKLADGLKIHDIKGKSESFESRSMVIKTSLSYTFSKILKLII